jgi:predicted permease
MNGAPDFLTSLQSVVLLMLMVLPGYLAVRFKVVTPEANPPFSSLLTKVTLPCLLFSAFAGNKYNSSILSKLGICFVVSLFTILVTILIAAVVFARMKDSPTKRVYIIASYFANAGFMGIPVINALFPGQSEPLMFTAVLMLAINIIAFTWIEYSVSGDRKFIRPINALLNPPNIAIVISLPFFV